MVNCAFYDECHERASVKIRHTGIPLCKKHFLANIEERVSRTVERYQMLGGTAEKPEHWVIAMSGGKDSQVLAEILLKKYGGSPLVRFTGLYIDVGVTGNKYTDESREIVEATCRRLNIPCVVVDIKREYGLDMDDIHVVCQCKGGSVRAECSSCGIIKRYLINKTSIELGADKVATGHHLTDEATTLMSNFFGMNIDQMARAQPWERKSVPGDEKKKAIAAATTTTMDYGVLIPRVKPFLEITEEETTMYTHFGSVVHVKTQCPYAVNATSSVLKKHMLALEMERPGTMLRLVRGFHSNLLPVIKAATASSTKKDSSKEKEKEKEEKKGEEEEEKGGVTPASAPEQPQDGVVLKTCERCGSLTVSPVCAYCKLVEQCLGWMKEHEPLLGHKGEGAHRCKICCPDIEDAALPAVAAGGKTGAARCNTNKKRAGESVEGTKTKVPKEAEEDNSK